MNTVLFEVLVRVNCVYVNPQTSQFWVIDYRIYDPDGDGQTKLDHVADILPSLVEQKLLAFSTVLMDSWYATKNLMQSIDNLGKYYYCPWKRNRLVDDTGAKEEYKQIDVLSWDGTELPKGKIIKHIGFS